MVKIVYEACLEEEKRKRTESEKFSSDRYLLLLTHVFFLVYLHGRIGAFVGF